MYTDSVGVDDVTEELIALSEKYKLNQLREFCMPTFIEKINTANCLKMYAYGFKHSFEEVRKIKPYLARIISTEMCSKTSN